MQLNLWPIHARCAALQRKLEIRNHGFRPEIHIRHLVITMNFAIEAQDDGIRGGIGPRTDAPLIGPPSKRELTECVCKAWQS